MPKHGKNYDKAAEGFDQTQRYAVTEAVKLAMGDESEAFRERLESQEAKEAFTAFLDKRPPDFSKFH